MENKMENQIQIFEHEQFGKIRVVVIGGKIYFVAADVCRALELGNVSQALNRVPDKDKRFATIPVRGIISIDTQGGEQKMLVVNEPGFYRLAFSSRKKEALDFQDWVYYEVLPSINATGSYSVAPAPAQLKSSKRSEGQKSPARVYVFRLADGTVFIVKIGQSKNVEKRKKEIERKYKVTIERTYYSPFFSRKVARLIEHACHQIFSAHSLGKELFDIEFEEACKVINVFVDVIACIPQVSNFERAEKLLAVANMMTDSSEKQQLLISAGKFFADEKFT